MPVKKGLTPSVDSLESSFEQFSALHGPPAWSFLREIGFNFTSTTPSVKGSSILDAPMERCRSGLLQHI